MAKRHLSPALFLAFSLGLVSATGMVGCSHSSGTASDADGVPPPDAGTDAVPQAAADGSNPVDPNAPGAAAPTADASAAPTADAGAPPPPPATPDATAQAAPPPAPDAMSPPAAPVDNAVAAPAPAAPPVDNAAAAPTAAAPAVAAATPPAASNSGGGTDDYTVQQGDTLMKIAFQTYGDLYKWHDIYQANQDRIKNPNDVPPGTVLKLDKPSVPVSLERNGDQYLIKVGDTLGTISNDVYGTKSKWKKLYENNKQLIKDPNKIYAGFYLYYTLTPEERDDLQKRGGPNQAKPLAEGQESQPQAEAEPAVQPDTTTAQAAPAPQQDARAPASVAQAPAQVQMQQPPQQAPQQPGQVVARAPNGAPSDDLNQVAQQPH